MTLKQRYDMFRRGLRSNTGRNALTFLVFLAISTAFWFLMAINDEVQHDFKLPVTLVDFPDNVTIISGATPVVNVTVKDKESALVKFGWGEMPQVRLNFDDFLKSDEHTLTYTVTQLNSSVRGVFGPTATILAVRPDSIKIEYTRNPGVKTKVHIDVEAHTKPQFIQYGPITMTPDSVMLYSNSSDLYVVKELTTAPIVLRDLADSTIVDAKLSVPAGMRAVPSSVRVSVPVEPLVSKTRRVELQVLNTPHGHRLVPFPSVVDISFLIPKSLYSAENTPVSAFVDFPSSTHEVEMRSDASGASSAVLPVHVGVVPPYYRNLQVSPSSVEFVIERD